MKRLIILILPVVIVGCAPKHEGQTRISPKETERCAWKKGEIAELTGYIWPSRANVPFYIEGEDGRSVHLRGKNIDRLEPGTCIYVKGTIDIVRYPRPEDYFNEKGGVNYGVALPQKFCYLDVTEFKILRIPQ